MCLACFAAPADPPALTSDLIARSASLNVRFLLNNQKADGSFHYRYDWRRQAYLPGVSPVRQAGALWGVALAYHHNPSPEVGKAVERGIGFVARHTRTSRENGAWVAYPGSFSGRTGIVALCALAHLEYLCSDGPPLPAGPLQAHCRRLDGYLRFLLAARREDHLWHQSYSLETGRAGLASPYFDGECLLALVKAARYLDRKDLRPIVLACADAGYAHNIKEALAKDPDSAITKGYYQWASMAFYELAVSGWPSTEKYGDYVIALADWMVDVHRTLTRTRNTAYAYEGIVHAYALAAARGDEQHARKFRAVIEKGLGKLISWQVGGPIPNEFIAAHKTDDPRAVGGVQNHASEAPLRIDVTQHQLHALLLARKYVFKD